MKLTLVKTVICEYSVKTLSEGRYAVVCINDNDTYNRIAETSSVKEAIRFMEALNNNLI